MSFGKRFVDGLIETSEQLGQGFASAADQHGQAIMSVGGGGDTTDRAEYADGDFAVADYVRDVGQGQGNDSGVLGDDLLAYAAGSITGGRFVATFQGSNSSMRVMG